MIEQCSGDCQPFDKLRAGCQLPTANRQSACPELAEGSIVRPRSPVSRLP
ncbi:MAG: hypothetical protein MUD01_03210 [Chloroflexaceae bacterium]|nr:hypothetical protein [Chloroflexaceae bacterium]